MRFCNRRSSPEIDFMVCAEISAVGLLHESLEVPCSPSLVGRYHHTKISKRLTLNLVQKVRSGFELGFSIHVGTSCIHIFILERRQRASLQRQRTSGVAWHRKGKERCWR